MAKLPRRPAYVLGAAASIVVRRELTAHSARAACWREVGERPRRVCTSHPRAAVSWERVPEKGSTSSNGQTTTTVRTAKSVCGDVCGEKAVRLGAPRLRVSGPRLGKADERRARGGGRDRTVRLAAGLRQ